MTVAELITKLQAFDPNTMVYTWEPDEEDKEGLALKPVTIVESEDGVVIV